MFDVARPGLADHGAFDWPVRGSEHLPRDSDWRAIDRALRRIARRRAEVDADEARWLLAAHRADVHRVLGHATFVEYIEHVLGYGPRVTLDRLRVAEALETLPAISHALASAALTYSAVRELTRVATPPTERAWLDAAHGKTVRQVEELVSGHAPGDLPTEPTHPDLRPQILRFEVSPETRALLRDAERRLSIEYGHMLDDDELIAALCRAVLVPTWARNSSAPAAADDDATDSTVADPTAAAAAADPAAPAADDLAAADPADPAAADYADPAADDPAADDHAERDRAEPEPAHQAPRYQVAISLCDACGRGWQDGAGRAIEISPTAIETACCDAQMIGRVDRTSDRAELVPSEASEPTPSATKRRAGTAAHGRATRTIPPATRRKVMRRDHGRCVVPGCRSTRWIDVHHLIHRADGGTHDPDNLACLCAAHHRAVHDGRIRVTGQAAEMAFFHCDGRAWGASPRVASSDGRARGAASRAEWTESSSIASTSSSPLPSPSSAAASSLSSASASSLSSASASSSSSSSSAVSSASAEAKAASKTVPIASMTESAATQSNPKLACDALRTMGYSASEARAAVERASAHVGTGARIEAWIRAALRACRVT